MEDDVEEINRILKRFQHEEVKDFLEWLRHKEATCDPDNEDTQEHLLQSSDHVG